MISPLKSCFVVLLSLCCFVIATAGTEAGTLFFDDFEDDTAGTAPVISGGNIGDSYGTVTNTLAVGANPDMHGNGSSQVLVGAGAGTLANHVPALFSGGAQPIHGLIISYDFYSSASGTHDNDGVRVSLVGNADNNRDVFIRNDRDEAIVIDGVPKPQVNFGADVWQNFTGLFTATDASAGQYDLTWRITNLATSAKVSGVQAVTVATVNFTDGKARGISLEVFEGNAANNSYTGYVDNISVLAIPEPATLVPMLLSLLCLIGHRRRS